MTQGEFNQICTDTSWTSTGTTLANEISGYKAWVFRKGYNPSTVPIFSSMNNIKNAINGNMPIMALENSPQGNHMYTVVGYKIEDGIEYLYTYTGLDIIPNAWIEKSAMTTLTGMICIN